MVRFFHILILLKYLKQIQRHLFYNQIFSSFSSLFRSSFLKCFESDTRWRSMTDSRFNLIVLTKPLSEHLLLLLRVTENRFQ